jgi:hypothetical protein
MIYRINDDAESTESIILEEITHFRKKNYNSSNKYPYVMTYYFKNEQESTLFFNNKELRDYHFDQINYQLQKTDGGIKPMEALMENLEKELKI